MEKINYIHILFLFFVLNLILITNTKISSANDDNPVFIFGKVIYADNGIPVSEGKIKAFIEDEINNQIRILETTTINPNGEFKILIHPGQFEHGIKIMAYPNDYDNLDVPFETKVTDLKEILALNNEGLQSVVIKVSRFNDDKHNTTDNKKSETESKSLLKQNFPNPFNPTTLIRFELPQTTNVTLKIYNMNGESVATLAENKNLSKGMNEFEFDASNMSSGIYVYRLTAGKYYETKKMMLLK